MPNVSCYKKGNFIFLYYFFPPFFPSTLLRVNGVSRADNIREWRGTTDTLSKLALHVKTMRNLIERKAKIFSYSFG